MISLLIALVLATWTAGWGFLVGLTWEHKEDAECMGGYWSLVFWMFFIWPKLLKVWFEENQDIIPRRELQDRLNRETMRRQLAEEKLSEQEVEDLIEATEFTLTLVPKEDY